MSKKSDQITKLLGQEELLKALPDTGIEGTLLELGLYAVLLREVAPSRAVSAVQALRKSYEDYNEARVAQAQELAEVIAPKGKGVAHLARHLPAARLVKLYLQEVYQKTHSLELEFLVEDPVGGARTLAQMPLVGTAAGCYLLYLAEEGEMPVTSGLVRVLDRLSVMTRTSSVRKVREALAADVPEENRLRLAFVLGAIVDGWCETRKPACWDCPMLDDCPTGKKVYREWKVQQERLEKQRQKEEARRLAQEKRDVARRAREEERERKRLEVEEKKRERQLEKERREAEKIAILKQREAERKKAIEAKKKAEAKQKADAKKKAEAQKKAEAKRKVDAKKKAAAKKNAAAKRKVDAKKKAAAKKKVVKKPTKKKMTAKKALKAGSGKKTTKTTRKPARKKTAGKG